MEIPFLKNKQNQGGGGPVETIRVSSDGDSPEKLLEMVADELIDSYHRGDRQAFLHAFRAFVLMTQDEEAA